MANGLCTVITSVSKLFQTTQNILHKVRRLHNKEVLTWSSPMSSWRRVLRTGPRRPPLRGLTNATRGDSGASSWATSNHGLAADTSPPPPPPPPRPPRAATLPAT
ncbi:hypothetical protein EE612_043108 [Oryza sativa]|nr:hypothetical protein EE612_043108 [Oryza sativa]